MKKVVYIVFFAVSLFLNGAFFIYGSMQKSKFEALADLCLELDKQIGAQKKEIQKLREQIKELNSVENLRVR